MTLLILYHSQAACYICHQYVRKLGSVYPSTVLIYVEKRMGCTKKCVNLHAILFSHLEYRILQVIMYSRRLRFVLEEMPAFLSAIVRLGST